MLLTSQIEHRKENLPLPLTHTLKYLPILPCHLPCLFLFTPLWLPLSSAPERQYPCIFKSVFLFEGYNKLLFSVWNNKDCHHGNSPITCALSGPFPSSKRSNYLATSKTDNNIKKSKARELSPSRLSGRWTPGLVQLIQSSRSGGSKQQELTLRHLMD